MAAFPLLLVVLGVIVLLLGKRLAVLGAAVGALVGVGILQLFSVTADPLLLFIIVAACAAGGFILAGLAKGVVNIVILIICILAGASIATGFLGLFNVTTTWVLWLGAAIGGLIGFMVSRRSGDGVLIVLAGLVGGLLVTRGLSVWMPFLTGPIGTLLVIALAALGVGVQGGIFAKRKAAAAEAAAAQAAAVPPPAAPASAVAVVPPAAPSPYAPPPAAPPAAAPTADTSAAPPPAS